MKIVFAQGNPGSQYAQTRHNIGWISIDHIAAAHGAVFSVSPKFHAAVAEITIQGEKVLLIKPTTFYNETGLSARALIDFYKLRAREDLLVIHDELALPFGTIRVREQGSDAGNNGIKSLISHLGDHFWRVRIGVWHESRNQQDDVAFVLGKFSASEYAHIVDTFIPYISTLVTEFATASLSASSISFEIK